MIALLRPLFHMLMRDGTYCPECHHRWSLHPPGRNCQSKGCCCQNERGKNGDY